jgi:hypothetical protein
MDVNKQPHDMQKTTRKRNPSLGVNDLRYTKCATPNKPTSSSPSLAGHRGTISFFQLETHILKDRMAWIQVGRFIRCFYER